MATLYIAEFVNIGGRSNFTVQAAQVPVVAEQTLALSSTAAQSAAFNNNTRFVRIAVDSSSAVCLAWGTNPTAVASVNMRMNLNTVEYFSVPPSASYKVSAVNVST